MLKVEPRDVLSLDSIFCCKTVPGVGGTEFAGVLRDNDSKRSGWGRGGEANKLSAAHSRSS